MLFVKKFWVAQVLDKKSMYTQKDFWILRLCIAPDWAPLVVTSGNKVWRHFLAHICLQYKNKGGGVLWRSRSEGWWHRNVLILGANRAIMTEYLRAAGTK
jgi:hypothetical protein